MFDYNLPSVFDNQLLMLILHFFYFSLCNTVNMFFRDFVDLLHIIQGSEGCKKIIIPAWVNFFKLKSSLCLKCTQLLKNPG